MRTQWIKPLSKAAGITDAAIYQMMKTAGKHAPYSEYEVLTMLRDRGRKCKGYKPLADAVGKPLPPLGEKKKVGGWTDQLVLNRCAKLLPGGANVSNKTRVRGWFKKAGFKDFKTMTEKEGLEVMQARGVPIDKFEYATSAPTGPKISPAISPGNGSDALMEEPAGSRGHLLKQYTALQDRLRAAMETIEQVNATMTEKDKKIAALVKTKSTVRSMLQQYESQILDVAKRHFGGLRRPLSYPIQALDEIRED